MSNPTNLTELAESLALTANENMHGVPDNYRAGYREALLDTRATVLAMIADVDRRIANNNVVKPAGPEWDVEQGILDGRIEAYEDVRGDFTPGGGIHKASPTLVAASHLAPMCLVCGKAIKHLPAGQGWSKSTRAPVWWSVTVPRSTRAWSSSATVRSMSRMAHAELTQLS